MEKKTKKIKNMTREELEERISHCVGFNQTNSRYYRHLLSEKKKREAAKDET